MNNPGDMQYYFKFEIVDGHLQYIKVQEETMTSREIIFPETGTTAIVTHMGQYGTIKFKINDKTYTTYGAIYGVKWEIHNDKDDVLHSATAGDNQRERWLAHSDTNDVIYIGHLDFGLSESDFDFLGDKYHKREDKHNLWMEV